MDQASIAYGDLYDALYKEGYHAKEKNHGRRFVEPMLRQLNFSTLLDCGCSNGVFVKLLQRNGKRVFGIDISTIAIRYAQEKYGTINCNVASVTDIPFKDNFFDIVFTSDMLEHLALKDVSKAVSEIKRVAKRYICLKVSDKVEENNEFTDKIHAQGLFKDIKNLHLTIKPLDWWAGQFQDDKWKRQGDILDMMVFYVN